MPRDDATMQEESEYGRYCPVSMASEVLADRWTPLILRELIHGSTRFNDIARGLPGISRSLLVKRLKHLEECHVLDRWPLPSGKGHHYHLTPAGKGLEPLLVDLGRWAVEWLYDELRHTDVDATTLMWWMHRYIDTAALPPKRVVVEFTHTAPVRETIWIVLEPGGPSVCTIHPRFETDVHVRATTPALGAIFIGTDSWTAAIRAGRVDVSGLPHLTRSITRWFRPSVFADDIRRASRQHATA